MIQRYQLRAYIQQMKLNIFIINFRCLSLISFNIQLRWRPLYFIPLYFY